MREIERRHFGRCLWQVVTEGRRSIIECLQFKATGTAIVVKQYETPIPRAGRGKPWPELMSVYVYLPIDDTNTWEGLDKALAARGEPELLAIVGCSPDGARRAYGRGSDEATAKSRCLQAARAYLQHRPDAGPLDKWTFRTGTTADLAAVTFARD